MSVDANFRLCRRLKAGQSRKDDKPYLNSSFFIPQDDVDAYLRSEQRPVSITLTQVQLHVQLW